MKYVSVDRSIFNKLSGRIVLWVPMALLISEGPAVGRRKVLYVYCSLYTLFSNPDLTRALSSFREATPDFEDSAPLAAVQLPAEKCSQNEISVFIEKMVDSARTSRTVDVELPSAARLALSHMLSPVRWVLGSTEKVEEGIATQVSLRILEDVRLEILKALRSGRVVEAYVLHAVDLKKSSIYYAIGSKVAENTALSRILSRDREARTRVERLTA